MSVLGGRKHWSDRSAGSHAWCLLQADAASGWVSGSSSRSARSRAAGDRGPRGLRPDRSRPLVALVGRRGHRGAVWLVRTEPLERSGGLIAATAVAMWPRSKRPCGNRRFRADRRHADRGTGRGTPTVELGGGGRGRARGAVLRRRRRSGVSLTIRRARSRLVGPTARQDTLVSMLSGTLRPPAAESGAGRPGRLPRQGGPMSASRGPTRSRSRRVVTVRDNVRRWLMSAAPRARWRWPAATTRSAGTVGLGASPSVPVSLNLHQRQLLRAPRARGRPEGLLSTRPSPPQSGRDDNAVR